jgi:hypothetical protein
MTPQKAKKICERFALKHKVIFEDEGECGFGRECVGFLKGESYVAHNPNRCDNYEPIPELECPDCYAPDGVRAYHKHDCLAVLGRGDDAIIGLAKWVEKMEAAGEVRIVKYETHAEGLQIMFSGVFGYAVTIKTK